MWLKYGLKAQKLLAQGVRSLLMNLLYKRKIPHPLEKAGWGIVSYKYEL